MNRFEIKGNIVDLHNREIYGATVAVTNGIITAITRTEVAAEVGYIIPPLVDSHVHIESSMLTPENFGHLVARHGTVAVVTDPHEIANVMGVEGIEFMVANSRRSPIECFFTIPSCVPATSFDVTGATISSADIEALAASGRFVALSEMMNVPGVLFGDEEVARKLEIAKRYNLPIDGHAPLLVGEDLARYVSAGITTDHECSNIEEATEKIACGMMIEIREGSAARNYDHLKCLIATHPDKVMFCTDDSHPDDILSRGHIDKLVRAAVSDGFDLYDVLRCASTNGINHYSLPIGQLRVGDSADMVVVDNLVDFNTLACYLRGERIDNREGRGEALALNNFSHDPINIEDIRTTIKGEITTIDIIPGEIITAVGSYTPAAQSECFESDTEHDVAKIVYINRYRNTAPVVAFARGFGLKRGALASSIAHDSHNIIAVGCSDSEIVAAVNELVRHSGALVACNGAHLCSLPLSIGGIMSDRAGEEVAADYKAMNSEVEAMGCPLKAPFMTLSFLSLVVIPEVKIGEQGLFSYSKFGWL